MNLKNISLILLAFFMCVQQTHNTPLATEKNIFSGSEHQVENCAFCKIITRQEPATILKETDKIIVIKSRSMGPKTNIRYLIIPKKHIVSINHLTPKDGEVAGLLLLMAQELSQESDEFRQFKFTINTGAAAGQTVFHLHAHFETYK